MMSVAILDRFLGYLRACGLELGYTRLSMTS